MERSVVNELEKYLEECDLVILVDIQGVDPMTEMLCRSEALFKTSKKLAILSTANFPVRSGKHIYKSVTEKEMRNYLEIYRSYESSDKLILLSDSRNYGSGWNYVSTGLLSVEEMFEAMLV